MGRKKTITDRGARQYIRIQDMGMWEKIDKLSTLDEYKNSFNKIINEALFYGLTEMHDIKFGKVEEDILQPQAKVLVHEEEYYLKIVRLLREVIINANVNKSVLCSLFHVEEKELEGTDIGKQFSKGYYQETPKFLLDYEIREIRKLMDIKEVGC